MTTLIDKLNNGATSLPMACRDMEQAAYEISRLHQLVEEAYNEGLFSGRPWAGSKARQALAHSIGE